MPQVPDEIILPLIKDVLNRKNWVIRGFDGTFTVPLNKRAELKEYTNKISFEDDINFFPVTRVLDHHNIIP